MASLVLRFNSADASRTIRRFQEKYPRAIQRSLNRAAVSTRAVMASHVAKDLKLKVGTVRDEITIQEATLTSGIVRISVVGARIPLVKFGVKGPLPSRGRGSVRGRGKTYPGAFMARMRSGHVGIFRRAGQSARKSIGAWSKNLPIIELYGPSLPHVFMKFMPVGLARGLESLQKNLASELRFALSGGSS